MYVPEYASVLSYFTAVITYNQDEIAAKHNVRMVA